MVVCEFLGVDPAKQRIITCHIGNGASMAAVDGGKCVDTSMGLTPVEGLMMGTRVGDVDPGALTFLMTKHGLNAEQMQTIINKESGVLGVSGVSSDMREIAQLSKPVTSVPPRPRYVYAPHYQIYRCLCS